MTTVSFASAKINELAQRRCHLPSQVLDQVLSLHILDVDHNDLPISVHPDRPQWMQITLTAPSTTPALLCWNCGITLSQICSLSETSVALYRANVDRIAILPHSEHSFNATSSLVKVGPSMMKSD